MPSSQWLVFPSVTNDFKTDHCRRQWDLINSEHDLRYLDLHAFDRAMLNSERQGGWGSGKLADVTTQDEVRVSCPFARLRQLLTCTLCLIPS